MMRFLLLLFLSLNATGAVLVELHFPAQVVRQGSLVDARIVLRSPESLSPKAIVGETIGKTVYFHEISPLMKREGSGELEANAKVIFVKVPSSHEVQENVGGVQLVLNWGGVKVEPTAPAEKFLFGALEMPEKSRWLIWASSGVVIVAILALVGLRVRKKILLERKRKARLEELKAQVLGCRSYEDVVSLWRKKHELIEVFPHLREPFLKLEGVLNLHQFKPKQSEAEKIEIVEAYRRFSRSVEGGFSGV